MNRRSQKRWALLVLLVWMPLYIVLAVVGMIWIEDYWGRLPFWVELVAYVVLGVLWVLPFRRVFLGIGRAE